MNGKKLILAAAILVSIIAACAERSSAALLGLVPNYPQISFDSLSFSNPYSTSFDAGTGVLSVTATPVTYVWAYRKPLAITGSKSLSIQAHLDSSGNLVADAEGDGIVITGDIIPNGVYTGPAYTGTLLTGKITRFGFFNGGTTDSYDFRFTPTGGAMYDVYKTSDIGVTVTSENSTFNGSFTVNFKGYTKGTQGVVPGPHIDVTESCLDAQGQDQPIPFSATLTNTGTEPLTKITCSSTPDTVLTGVPATDLAAGASAVITGSYLPTTTPSTGKITCSGTGSGSQVTVSASSSATCKVLATPAFTVAANCTDAPEPGRPIAVSATMTNTGTENLTGFSCWDSYGTILAGVPVTLGPNQTATISGSYLATGSGSIDTITCSANGALDSTPVSASSSATCNILTKPLLAVSESCTDAPEPGQPIKVSGTLSNTGNELLTGISCSDSNGTAIAGVPSTLAPGATASLSSSYVPTASGSVDTITCSAKGAINNAPVTSESSSTCNIVTNPKMALTESCLDAPAPGEAIVLSVHLGNTGNEPLSGISCVDSRGAALAGVPTTLAVGATVDFTGSYIPTANGSIDTITCLASGSINSAPVSTNSSATCNIITHLSLSVAETCLNAPAPGQPITLSGVITNNGNETLNAITCSDSRGATLTGIPVTLAPGTSASFGGSYTPSSSPSSDTITCSATGAISSATVSGNSSATCSILNPAIKIVKYTNGIDAPTAPGPKIPFAAAVTWTYVVTNTGNVTLADVTVTDDKVGSVSCPANTLAVGASMTCSASGTAIAGQYENIGTATGSSEGATVTSSYPSHYYGSTASGCTYTQGFWKNHPDRWPVASLTLGIMNYTKDELLSVLQTPVQGNGLVSLAHQLIAAKLNLANGASLTQEIQSAVGTADNLIGSMVVPPIGSGYLATSDTSILEGTLDTYNSGLSVNGPGHCDDLPALPCTGSIGNLVWKDVNGNGIQDAGEPGIAGAAVTLTNTLTGETRTDTTDDGGYYMFTGICAANYTVAASTPAGLLPSPSMQGTNRDIDSNGSPARVSLPTDSYNDNSVDFGFYPQTCTGTIGDLAWDDLNANGIQDAGEPGIAGVPLALKNALTGATVATTVTDDSGRYNFTALCAGSYTVIAATPSGFSVTPSLKGSDRSKDSNGSPATVTLATNSSTDFTVDFGYYRPVTCTGSIGDLIWNDLNSNGMQDAGEPGLSGVAVTLTNLTSGATQTATSDANGRYSFTGLCSGGYEVSVQTPPAFSPSAALQGSDSSKDSNNMPASVTLKSNSSADSTIDFGFYKTPTPGQATGCSLGYWKQHPNNWPAASHTTDNFDTVFGTDGFKNDITLLQALKLGGGGLSKLARQGTAALLNAEDARITAFPLTVNDLKAAIQNAINTGNYEPLATQLDNYNNLGCPLN